MISDEKQIRILLQKIWFVFCEWCPVNVQWTTIADAQTDYYCFSSRHPDKQPHVIKTRKRGTW